MHQVLLLFLTTVLAITDSLLLAQQPSKQPSLWTVHIDEVEPAMTQEFERLVGMQFKTRNAIFKEHNIPIKPSFEIVASGSKFMRFVSRESYAELDQPSKFPDVVRALLKERVNIMDAAIHATLHNHHNEIWQLDDESSYLPKQFLSDELKPKFIRIHTEWVKPGKSTLYDSVMMRFHAALEKNRFPFACLVFFSNYGDGASQYLWHAESKEEFLKAQTPQEILIAAYGMEEGRKLFEQWAECVMNATDTDAVPRQDLIDLDPNEPWFNISGKK